MTEFRDFGTGTAVMLHGAQPVIPAREPDFHWNGRPVFRCKVCGSRYERVENLAAVLAHEAEAHGPTVRESRILGPDGQAVLIAEG